MEAFLADITRQTIFKDCELLLFNANSPGNEEPIIKPYLEKYPNIYYEKLAVDPGVYGVWNLGLKKAKADYVTNANLDDRRNPEILAIHANALDEDPEVDLVYSGYYITYKPNETFENNSATAICAGSEFSPQALFMCLPGPQPTWRKSMHEKCGYFSEEFKSSGDLELWNRAAINGSKFKKVPVLGGLYYVSPKGLSTKQDSKKNSEDRFILGAYGYLWKNMPAQPPTLLIKIATRGKPTEFFKTLYSYYNALTGHCSYQFIVSLDQKDVSMNNPAIIEKLNTYPNLKYTFGPWPSLVAAQNRDLDKGQDFEFLLLGNDDLVSVQDKFDYILIVQMRKFYPEGDGILFLKNGDSNAISLIMGKKYYDRFGYIFHPDYQSSGYLDEMLMVSKILRKGNMVSSHVFESSPSSKSELAEEVSPEDQKTFKEHFLHSYSLPKNAIEESNPKIWSILICSLEERHQSFDKLKTKLDKQIQEAGLQDKIEVLSYIDNRETPVGTKRNALVSRSSGKYIAFIDDDDDVHDQYISMIYEKLLNDPDCVSLEGIITTDGNNPKKFIHSLAYNHYFEKDGVYYRPPNHLNPIKRQYAVQFQFPEKNYGEDTDWALQIASTGVLKNEEVIDRPYYFYLFQNK